MFNNEAYDNAKGKHKPLREIIVHRLCHFLPILEWLPKYKWREDLPFDIIGGLTDGVMQISQGNIGNCQFLRKKINPLKRIQVQINLLAEKLFIITIIEKKGKDVKS